MKPIVFNYQDYKAQKAKIADLTAENEKLKEQVADLQIRCRIAEKARETAYWADATGGRFFDGNWNVAYCSKCGHADLTCHKYCPDCGSLMDNPEEGEA